VLTRPKQGFAIPPARWFRGDWQEMVRPLFLESEMSQYFARPCLERILKEQAAGHIDHGEHLWLLLIFAVWHEHYLHERPAPSAHPAPLPRGEPEPRFLTVPEYADKPSFM
jgi:asparagine synthase (glutamine-hydrolysing)